MHQKYYRSYMLVLLTVVYAFNFMDRNVLGLLMQDIKLDLQLSDSQMGFLSGIAFALFYSTLGIPIARWADVGNRASIISITVALWSAMVFLCGMATSYIQLLLCRVGVAVGEAGCVPPAQSLISDYYSRAERSRAMSHYMLGAPLSVILGFALAGWINQLYGWRATFLAIGVPGLVLALIVRISLREPRLQAVRPSSQDDRAKVAMEPQAGYLTVFRTLWRQLAYRHLVLGFTLLYLFSYGIAQWVPAFLIRTHHIATGELGTWYALIWGVGGAFGTYAGGYLASNHAINNEPLQLRMMGAVLVGFIPLYLGIYLSDNIYFAFALMLIGAIVYCSIFGPLFAMIQEVVPPQMRAMSVAIVLLFSNLIGMGLGPIIVGVMSDVLRSSLGDESLRTALLMWTPGYAWAAFHLLRAARYVQADIATSRHGENRLVRQHSHAVQV